ncbi:MAG: hypothetical protein V4733_01105 [Verrucomicrobiota bacterium]
MKRQFKGERRRPAGIRRHPASTLLFFCLLAATPAHAILDENGNGLSDLFEARFHNGTLFPDNHPKFLPDANPDGDHWSTALEAIIGTDPFSGNSPDGMLRPLVSRTRAVLGEPDASGNPVVVTPATIHVSFPTIAGKFYTLKASATLMAGSWTNAGEPFIGSGSVSTFHFPLPDPAKQFFTVYVEDIDQDFDGLSNSEEIELSTDPGNFDSDFDGASDLAEAAAGTDPKIAGNPLGHDDTDGIPNWQDADPADAAVCWRKAPESRYAIIELPATSGSADALGPSGHVIAHSRGHSSSSNYGYVPADFENFVWKPGATSWISLPASTTLFLECLDIDGNGNIYGKTGGSDRYSEFIALSHMDPIHLHTREVHCQWQATADGTYQAAVPCFSEDQGISQSGIVWYEFYGTDGMRSWLPLFDPVVVGNSVLAGLVYPYSADQEEACELMCLSGASSIKLTDKVNRWLNNLAITGSGNGWCVWTVTPHGGTGVTAFGKAGDGGVFERFDPPPGVTRHPVGFGGIDPQYLAEGVLETVVWRAPDALNFPGNLLSGTLKNTPAGNKEWTWTESTLRPDMPSGQINSRGEGISDSRIWRNGTWRELTTLMPDNHGYTDIRTIDTNSAGMILVHAKKDNVDKDLLLVPIDIRWEEIGAYNDSSGNPVEAFENIDEHIDPWTKVPNGLRLFPGYKNPDKTKLRNAINVVVTAGTAFVGKIVKVKAFDIDDTTNEAIDREHPENGNSKAIIDPNDKPNDGVPIVRVGDDNLTDYLGTPQSGRFFESGSWSDDEAEATVDANGEARFTFQTGMQPGNNYKIVVTHIDGHAFTPAQVTDPAADTYLGPRPQETSKAPSTPMLTVWRKLWVENDSMEAIPEDAFGNKLNDLHGTEQVPAILGASYDPATNRTRFRIPPPNDFSSFSTLENGILKIQGVRHPVPATEASDPWLPDDFGVFIEGDHSAIPVGSGFRLYDDDDLGLNAASLPRIDLVNEQMKSYYRKGFIEVVDAAKEDPGKDHNPNKNVPFRQNESVVALDTIADDSIDLTDRNELWTCPVVACYQREQDSDIDPNVTNFGDAESAGLGETNKIGFRDSEFSAVFAETCRDNYATLPLNPSRNPISLAEFIVIVASHEMGHHPLEKGAEQDHAEGGIMGEGSSDVPLYKSKGEAKFTPHSISRFRKTTQWSK